MDSIGALKARSLIEKIKPRYPLDLEWFSQQPELGLDKPVKILSCNKLPDEVTATLVPHPDLRYYYILHNPIYNDERIRFGIAHELAHLYLGHDGYSIGDDEDPDIKAEADDFATEILMPRFQVRIAAAKLFKLNPLKLVHKLRSKKYFWVSMEATCRRLLEIGIVKGAYILYDRQNLYFAYNYNGFKLGFPAKKVLLDTYLNLEKKETSITTHSNPMGRIINFYAQKFSNGKVFGAFVYEEEYDIQKYDDLVQEILSIYIDKAQ